MADDRRKDTARYSLWPRDRRRALAMGLIAGIVGAVALAFGAVAGWLTPERLTQTAVVDTFQAVNGVHPGFRRNHAKGVCVAGTFESNGAGTLLSRAAVFQAGTVPVTGRFAVAVGKPFVPDTQTEVRSMALAFRPSGGGEWRTGINDIPVFPVRTAEAFWQMLSANLPDPATGKPDPEATASFFAAHPEAARAVAQIRARPISTGFANASYNSLNAFRFLDEAGVATPVRWSMEAVDPFVPETPDAAAPDDKNYLFDALIARIAGGPVKWRLVVTVGGPEDPTDDPTIAWPAERERLEVGTLSLDRIEAEGPHDCRDVNFDPLVLPDGIAPSDDPILSARSATYAVSYRRRAGEPKSPSEVQVPDTPKRSPAQ